MTTITIDRTLLVRMEKELFLARNYGGILRDEPLLNEVSAALSAPATAPEFPADWAQMIHYPECWDTAAYPELRYAIHEALAWSGCSVCKPATAPERKPMTAKRIDAAIETAPEPSTEVAVGKLCKSLREDLDYAWTWHCNIAMAAFDAGCPHDVANEGAARFMQLLAGVDTREHPAFQGTQDHPMRNDKTVPKPSAH